MKKVAIVISSHNGHTMKVAEVMSRQLLESCHSVEIYNVMHGAGPTRTELRRYDVVLVGGPIYFGEYSEQLLDWTSAVHEQLNLMNCGFFSVSLNAGLQRRRAQKSTEQSLNRFMKQTGLAPSFVAGIAGALPYRQSGLFKKLLFRWFSTAKVRLSEASVCHDLTDWRQVSRFTRAAVENDICSEFSTANRPVTSRTVVTPIGLPYAA